jgi:hypothetical protein
MKKIFIRSPYFIEINETGQTGSRVELFFWNKGTTEPANPTYTLSKDIVSTTQRLNSYNISEYAKGFIKPIAPINVIEPTEEYFQTWCYCKVKRYKNVSGTYTLLDTETFVCLNGYTNYLNGYNQFTDDVVVPLLNVDIKQLHNNYINCWIDENEEVESYSWVYGTDEFDIDSEGSLYKLPLNYSELNFLYISDPEIDTFFNVVAESVCEPVFTPVVCKFINRFGGWQFLTFFKANSSSIEVNSKEYNLLPSSIDYNPLQGQRRIFNGQGKQKIKCNTGWVDENYSDLIQDLLLSEVVLLDNKPALVKSQSFDIKTHLKDKNINYEIEFEYNYGLINDVI